MDFEKEAAVWDAEPRRVKLANDVAEAIILPINKDTGEFKEFLYERNQPLVDVIYEKFEFVSACLDTGEVPTKADDEMFEFKHLLRGPVSV